MQNINIDKVVSDSIFNKKSNIDPMEATFNTISYCKFIENNITSDTLLHLLCTIDTLYKSVGLMRILEQSKIYVQCDIEIEKYNDTETVWVRLVRANSG